MPDGANRSSSVAVIGGGPAGLIAAETLATSGIAVTVYEFRASVGRKFLLAGRGGLNITHSESFEQFTSRYGDAEPTIKRALEAFSRDDLQAWCEDLGQPTFVGTSGRTFPKAFKSTPLLRAWLARVSGLGVELRLGHEWLGFGRSEQQIQPLFRADGVDLAVDVDAVVLGLGGASWPRVSSSGGWADVMTAAGVDVTELRPSNCGVSIEWTELMQQRHAGEPLKNVVVTVGETSTRGDCIITTSGLEGGPIYAHSAAIHSALRAGVARPIAMDLHPDLSPSQLEQRLERSRPKDSLTTKLRRVGIDGAKLALLREATSNQIPKDHAELASLLKQVRLPADGLMAIDRAISTAGGVALSEINEHFMLSKMPGVFVAGEMLDWDAPTGGYLLQGCFSTGVAAANGVASWLRGDLGRR